MSHYLHYLRNAAWAAALATSFIITTGCGDDDDNITTPTEPAARVSDLPAAPPPSSPTGTPEPTGTSVGQRVGFLGMVHSIGANTLVVTGKTVRIDSGTMMKTLDGTRIDLSDIRKGDFVRVKGIQQSDDSVRGEVVTLQLDKPRPADSVAPKPDTSDPEGSKVDFFGAVGSINGKILGVADKRVQVDAETILMKLDGSAIGFTDIKLGDFLKVEGVVSNGVVKAKLVVLQKP